ncbi:hypothetical protein Fcan01_09034 [Folsomia candida]|uniref:Uncharacterized protein n=1 Tax=Folsomia candida TaxID=158441 RepID=A0A226EG03_FOLCA|nr:hypothetical protein Fcan01_09034 [Folsomia candida]
MKSILPIVLILSLTALFLVHETDAQFWIRPYPPPYPRPYPYPGGPWFPPPGPYPRPPHCMGVMCAMCAGPTFPGECCPRCGFWPPYFSPYPKLTPTAFDRANAHTSLVPCVSDTRRRANAVRAAAATTSLVRCAWGGRLPDDAAQSADIRILNHHFIWTDFRTTLIFDPL